MRQVAARWVTSLSILLGLLVVSSTPAAAQDGGLRAGLSVDPDQFYFGGHLETGPLIDRLHFRPNVEIGFGDDLTLIGANMEFVYKFPRRSGWGIYAGGGPALNVFIVDDDINDNDDSDTEAGLNLLVGVENASGLFFEFKFGVVDSPDFKFGVGWTFR
jgi:hypothetical protein